ncbi:uncharacterized protein TRIREDRAFT_33949, partial [Trichoderma reesei QM6a]
AFRGPKGALRHSRHLCRKMGIVAGGTGVTPTFQIIRTICERGRGTAQLGLIYANRTEEDALLRQEPDRFVKPYQGIFKDYYCL